MCLFIDYDGDGTYLGDGKRTARKPHRCMECGRSIDPGERYQFWTWAYDGRAETSKMCAHCEAVLDLGTSITGCPRQWNASWLYDRDPEVGFVANCLEDDGHDLSEAESTQLYACFEGAERKWRNPDGSLMPLPTEAVPA